MLLLLLLLQASSPLPSAECCEGEGEGDQQSNILTPPLRRILRWGGGDGEELIAT